MTEATTELDTVNICATDFEAIVKRAAAGYKGKAQELESAIGALVLGHLYGWKVLRVIHGGNAYAKYERILGLTFRKTCPEVGPLAHRSLGFRVATQAEDFWRVVRGQEPGRSPELV